METSRTDGSMREMRKLKCVFPALHKMFCREKNITIEWFPRKGKIIGMFTQFTFVNLEAE